MGCVVSVFTNDWKGINSTSGLDSRAGDDSPTSDIERDLSYWFTQQHVFLLKSGNYLKLVAIDKYGKNIAIDS